MAGMFDWMKGGKSKTRRRTSGRRSEAENRGGAEARDYGAATEAVSLGELERPRPVGPHDPTPPPISSNPARTEQAPGPALNPRPPEPVSDPGATEYISVARAAGALVGILIVKEGDTKDEIYRVLDGENTIGRGDEAKVCTGNQDSAISRLHAMIIHDEGSFGLRPLKEGTNPTYLNDKEVSGGAALADGDLIRIGNTTLKFRMS